MRAAPEFAPRFTFLSLLIVVLTVGWWLLARGLGEDGLRLDEGTYGLVVAEILERGDWTHLYLEEDHFLNKPPLVFWMMAASAGIFGLDEVSLRLPTVVAMAGLVVLLTLVAWRRVGWAGAVLAPLLVISAPRPLAFHGWRNAVTEPWITLWATIALLLIGRAGSRARFLPVIALACLCAVGKGMAIPLLLALTAAIQQTATGRPADRASHAAPPRRLGPALSVFLSIFGPSLAFYLLFWLWNYPSIRELAAFIEKDWYLRARGQLQGEHVRPLFFFFDRIWSDFGPWLVLAVPAYLPSEWRRLRSRGDLEGIALRLFPLVALVVLSIPASKLPWYLYPAYPAIALVIADGVDRLARRSQRPWVAAAIFLPIFALLSIRVATSARKIQRSPPNSLHRLSLFLDRERPGEVLYDPRLEVTEFRPREWNRFALRHLLHAERWDPQAPPPSNDCRFLLAADLGPEWRRAVPSGTPAVRVHKQYPEAVEADLYVIDLCGGTFAARAPAEARRTVG